MGRVGLEGLNGKKAKEKERRDGFDLVGWLWQAEMG